MIGQGKNNAFESYARNIEKMGATLLEINSKAETFTVHFTSFDH
jgi:hypothetical protein